MRAGLFREGPEPLEASIMDHRGLLNVEDDQSELKPWKEDCPGFCSDRSVTWEDSMKPVAWKHQGQGNATL